MEQLLETTIGSLLLQELNQLFHPVTLYAGPVAAALPYLLHLLLMVFSETLTCDQFHMLAAVFSGFGAAYIAGGSFYVGQSVYLIGGGAYQLFNNSAFCQKNPSSLFLWIGDLTGKAGVAVLGWLEDFVQMLLATYSCTTFSTITGIILATGFFSTIFVDFWGGFYTILLGGYMSMGYSGHCGESILGTGEEVSKAFDGNAEVVKALVMEAIAGRS